MPGRFDRYDYDPRILTRMKTDAAAQLERMPFLGTAPFAIISIYQGAQAGGLRFHCVALLVPTTSAAVGMTVAMADVGRGVA